MPIEPPVGRVSNPPLSREQSLCAHLWVQSASICVFRAPSVPSVDPCPSLPLGGPAWPSALCTLPCPLWTTSRNPIRAQSAPIRGQTFRVLAVNPTQTFRAPLCPLWTTSPLSRRVPHELPPERRDVIVPQHNHHAHKPDKRQAPHYLAQRLTLLAEHLVRP